MVIHFKFIRLCSPTLIELKAQAFLEGPNKKATKAESSESEIKLAWDSAGGVVTSERPEDLLQALSDAREGDLNASWASEMRPTQNPWPTQKVDPP